MDEFALIELMLAGQPPGARPGLVVGPGDDAAVIAPPAGCELAVSTDSVVADRHFPANAHPEVVGYRALAVNLSDLAAMGASPGWYTVALTAPELEAEWARGFAAGLAAAADEAGIVLAGGNVSGGPLAVTVTVIGTLPAGSALLRSTAAAGDRVLVSGVLGEARTGLETLLAHPARAPAIDLAARGDLEPSVGRYLMPRARLALGEGLRGVASACIDLSDGLLADLGHVCTASGAGATVWLDALPVASCDPRAALAAGDDYELCFTVPAARLAAAREAADRAGVPVTEVGVIEPGGGVRCLDARGEAVAVPASGFRHFG